MGSQRYVTAVQKSGARQRAPLFPVIIPHPNRDTKVAGVALPLVLFVIALLSAIVISLSHSTFLGTRILGVSERRLEAEYLLKSLVTVAAALIKLDASSNADGRGDTWATFLEGAPLPSDLLQQLGIDDRDLRAYLEIKPTNSSLRIDLVSQTKPTQTVHRDYFQRLFKICLGQDLTEEPDHLRRFNNRRFSINDMVANLIDYLDSDSDPYQQDGFMGIESEELEDIFPTQGNKKLTNAQALLRIPGFTPRRVQRLANFVSFTGTSRININVASPEVLQAIHEDLTSTEVQQLIDFIHDNGPLQNVRDLQDLAFYEEKISAFISNLTTTSENFDVIAKVEYPQGSYFIKAHIQESTQSPTLWPKVLEQQLY